MNMQVLVLDVTYVAVDALTPHPNNPRTHSKKQLAQIAKSIEQFGFTNPILIDDDNCVIAGHGRLEAAKSIKLKTVPTLSITHLTPDEIRAYRIADNKLAALSGWDDEILAMEFEYLDSIDFDTQLTGFDVPEIDLLLNQALQEDTSSPEDVPEPDRTRLAITQAGDLWKLGKHRLLCADSLQSKNIDTLMGTKQANMVFTDPPYNVPVNGHVGGKGKAQHPEFAMASGEMTEEEFQIFLKTAIRHLVDCSHDGALHYICMDWRHIKPLLTVAEAFYSDYKNLCVWSKDNGGMGSLYRSQHELIAVFKFGDAPHRNNVELGKNGRNRTNIWKYPGVNSFSTKDRDATLAMHPTVKPVAMIADALLDCTKPKDIVLDIFGGSGSTLLAAEKKRRRARLIEIDPHYCDVTIERFQTLTGKEAIHLESQQTFNERRKIQDTIGEQNNA